MTDLSRRSFLRGALTLVAVATLPAAVLADDLPMLFGDGVADDTAALNAMVRGLPFRTADGFKGSAEQCVLREATLRINGTLHIDRMGFLFIERCKIYFKQRQDGEVNLLVTMNSVVSFNDSELILEGFHKEGSCLST